MLHGRSSASTLWEAICLRQHHCWLAFNVLLMMGHCFAEQADGFFCQKTVLPVSVIQPFGKGNDFLRINDDGPVILRTIMRWWSPAIIDTPFGRLMRPYVCVSRVSLQDNQQMSLSVFLFLQKTLSWRKQVQYLALSILKSKFGLDLGINNFNECTFVIANRLLTFLHRICLCPDISWRWDAISIPISLSAHAIDLKLWRPFHRFLFSKSARHANLRTSSTKSTRFT